MTLFAVTVYKGNQISASSLLSPIVFEFSACEVTWPYPSITYGDQAFFNGPLAKQKWSKFNCSILLGSFSFSFSMSWRFSGFSSFLISYPSSFLLLTSILCLILGACSLAFLLFIFPVYYKLCPVSSHFCVSSKSLYANIFLCHNFSDVFFLNLCDFIFNNKVMHTGKEYLKYISM